MTTPRRGIIEASSRHHPSKPAPVLPRWSAVLRALREARGVTQDGWAALVGIGRATVQRWERGEAVPSAFASEALLTVCRDGGLLRTFERGPLRGLSVTADMLRELLAEARLSAAPGRTTPPPIVLLPPRPPLPRSDLSTPLTRLVGRKEEISQIRALLGTSRLVTLTGAGGSGKTRLALELAAELAERFADGVAFVDLAQLADVDLVPEAIAQAVGIQGADPLPLVERIISALRDRSLLLILDNFEHLLPVAPLVPRLLLAASGLTVLATSRAPLRVRGEREFPIAPLALPGPEDTALDVLARCPAVALFGERAQDVRPDFTLTEANAQVVADICRRLDGLPLGLELAATRVRHLSLEAIAARLDRRLALLTDGPRDLPARQQTLRGAIEWSYVLLRDEEQRLFRRLAVFASGCTVEAVAAVCDVQGDLRLDAFSGLASLVEFSLLQRRDEPDGEPRFSMLETLREYGRERLKESGEADMLQRRHAAYFASLAEANEPRLLRAGAAAVARRLDAELDNLRAARTWSTAQTDGGDAALRLAGALPYYWHYHALDEGRRATAEALALPAATLDSKAGARALLAAGILAHESRDFSAARPPLESCVRLGPERCGPRTHALALAYLSSLLVDAGELDEARRLARESLERCRSLDEPFGLVWANVALFKAHLRTRDTAGARGFADEVLRLAPLTGREPLGLSVQAMVDIAEGRYDQARARGVEILALARERDHFFVIADWLNHMAVIALRQDDLREAETLLEQSVALWRRIGGDTSRPLADLGWVVLHQGGPPRRAALLLAEALRLSHQRGRHPTVVRSLSGLARVAALEGDAARAARLIGAAEAWREAHGLPAPEPPGVDISRTTAAVHDQLGEVASAAARAAGVALDAAVAEALEGVLNAAAAPGEPREAPAPPGGAAAHGSGQDS